MTGIYRVARQGWLNMGRLTAWQHQPSMLFSTLFPALWSPEVATSRPAASGLSRLTSLIPSLADMAWLAVPKRKVTPHRKGNRSATKYIRFVPVVSRCSKCDRVFQQHQLPSKCEKEECPAFNLRERPSV